MDRYIVREPRAGREYPQGNQMLAFSPGNDSTMIPPEGMYYGGYAAPFPLHPGGGSSGFIGVPHVNARAFAPANHVPGQGQVMSGIDPRYLAAYAENNAAYGSAGQQHQMQREQNHAPICSSMSNHQLGEDYQNRSFAGVTRFKSTSVPQISYGQPTIYQRYEMPKSKPVPHDNIAMNAQQNRQEIKVAAQNVPPIPSPKHPAIQIDFQKTEYQNQATTRFDRMKALNKSGPRAFSGPVEKVVKWHKALQDIGVLVLYEIVAKCVNVRRGEGCAKNLVVRDDSGPAMQVVYYEIDFLLPELKPPCTVRVIGRMMPGTSRLQAFNVRPATGDDVATLPRRAAVAAHHVAKLCKEYGNNIV